MGSLWWDNSAAYLSYTFDFIYAHRNIYYFIMHYKEINLLAATSSSRSDDVTLFACLFAFLFACLSPYFS